MKSLILRDFEVRGILDGSITQIVRAVKLPHQNPLGVWESMRLGGPDGGKTRDGKTIPEQGGIWHTRTGECIGSPFGQPGELLTGKETWGYSPEFQTKSTGHICYKADPEHKYDGVKWRSSSQMPPRASRLTLKNKAVRVERVQDCSEPDARRRGATIEAVLDFSRVKGVRRPAGFAWRDIFMTANGLDAWGENPWVWVMDIEKVQKS